MAVRNLVCAFQLVLCSAIAICLEQALRRDMDGYGGHFWFEYITIAKICSYEYPKKCELSPLREIVNNH